jgi:predicted transcriptional regulator
MAYRPSLDERDLEVLQLLWKAGPLKPGDLQKRLSFQMKNPALRWLLNDLVARGQLHRKKEGKAFLYSAAVERRNTEALARGYRLLKEDCQGTG